MVPSRALAQLPHIFYWTLPPTTYQYGLSPVDFQPPSQARCLHTTHVPGRPPHALAEKAKVVFRLVVSASDQRAW